MSPIKGDSNKERIYMMTVEVNSTNYNIQSHFPKEKKTLPTWKKKFK